MLKIFIPKEEGIFRIAADEFVSFWHRVTGKKLSVTLKDDGKSDLVVLGSDAVNAFTHAKIIEKVIPQFSIATDTDGYELVSAADGNGRNLLFIAGGRPRSLLYGVYRFFELRADCRYFWDGDIVPARKSIDISGLKVCEKPRFEYRGLRYFAHRSLNRFQAEHWDFPEWKKEIDWILKKRMNLFMLRIGLDDLFQKAFPGIVGYPGWEVPESKDRSYDDRNLFWSLKYRGELRKKILAYARERDLLHPEDVGTMTHWYSRTPHEYLEKVKPDFMPQATSGYGEKTGLVWDIRQDKNLDAYFHLTETHIREYGSPAMFHTIGLAERRCYEDRASNHQMKLYTYRRIIQKLRGKHPHAPLLIGSWDFCMYWTPEEVRELVVELNPRNTILFDYTSDTDDELRTFQNWDLVNKFPWIYGIFHAFEPNTDVRGNYNAIERRLPIAAEDPMCKGMVLWPECSHTDTLLLEYLAANAWNPCECNLKIKSFLEKFCANRYAGKDRGMSGLWRKMLPLIKARHWNGPGRRPEMSTVFQFSEIFFRPLQEFLYPYNGDEWWKNTEKRAAFFHDVLREPVKDAPEIFRNLAAVDRKNAHEFVLRDLIDLARTAAARVLHFGCCKLILGLEAWRDGKDNAVEILDLLKRNRTMLSLLGELLAAHDDYSLYASLRDLQSKQKCNPKFEYTLKGNAENGYCRAYITELVTDVYLPEMDAVAGEIRKYLKAGKRVRMNYTEEKLAAMQKPVADAFYRKPLAEMAPDRKRAFANLSATLEKMAVESEKIISQQ
ncbi:MAG: Alpha-N-acetylglucosaminidase (NAGLU) tim-barrel domain protein [Lentisphaerae bacterium ADurb.Bin242]|nr:MAG: Alpha-N-acetylglucosaminidase (NAGLU) tim-barrel domain protein [Lentisphaerae bacterium ADurb.Bin242]